MSSYADDRFAAVAAIGTSDGSPYRLTISTTAATLSGLPRGRYVVILEGVSHVLTRTGGAAAAPASGSAALTNTCALSSGYTYSHNVTGDLSAITITGGGEMILQPVPVPG